MSRVYSSSAVLPWVMLQVLKEDPRGATKLAFRRRERKVKKVGKEASEMAGNWRGKKRKGKRKNRRVINRERKIELLKVFNKGKQDHVQQCEE